MATPHFLAIDDASAQLLEALDVTLHLGVEALSRALHRLLLRKLEGLRQLQGFAMLILDDPPHPLLPALGLFFRLALHSRSWNKLELLCSFLALQTHAHYLRQLDSLRPWDPHQGNIAPSASSWSAAPL
eukprot:scaffold70_cov242-Pinguiococcus_pyrenoidosus.AAC.6